MLDELFGRKSLKERIAELEAETDRLRERYEAESERRSEAVTERQEAQERVNRLEDRIAQLEGELDRREESTSTLAYRRRTRLRGNRLEAVLDRLQSVRTGPEGALTVTIDDSTPVPDSVADHLGERTTLLENASPCLCCLDDAGIVAVTLSTPLCPTLEPTWDETFHLQREWFLPAGTYTLALVRADLFALGVYEDGERTTYRGFESDVKSKHSKGGFSQARFDRIRDEQIATHVDRCVDALTDTLTGPLYLVGQRSVIDLLLDEHPFDPTAITAVDASGAPKNALDDAHRSFFTADVRVL